VRESTNWMRGGIIDKKKGGGSQAQDCYFRTKRKEKHRQGNKRRSVRGRREKKLGGRCRRTGNALLQCHSEKVYENNRDARFVGTHQIKGRFEVQGWEKKRSACGGVAPLWEIARKGGIRVSNRVWWDQEAPLIRGDVRKTKRRENNAMFENVKDRSAPSILFSPEGWREKPAQARNERGKTLCCGRRRDGGLRRLQTRKRKYRVKKEEEGSNDGWGLCGVQPRGGIKPKRGVNSGRESYLKGIRLPQKGRIRKNQRNDSTEDGGTLGSDGKVQETIIHRGKKKKKTA